MEVFCVCGNPTRKDRLLLKLHDHFPKVRLPLWATLLAAVLLAGAITLLALWCQPNALRSVLAVFRAQPLLIILNCLPVGMLLLVFTCLLRNVFFAGALANFAVCALSIANRIKIEVIKTDNNFVGSIFFDCNIVFSLFHYALSPFKSCSLR